MSKSALPSGAAVAPPAKLADALRDRGIWLLFVLGVATGLPAGWTWYGQYEWPGYVALEDESGLALTALGLVGLVILLIAPFLDRFPAPLFGALGHRRSWVALALSCALALTTVFAVAAGIEPGFGLVRGILALPVVALLWIALDALRIELFPGRPQAIALGAQYAGALAGVAVARLAGEALSSSPLMPAALSVLLALGLGAALLIAEPAPRPAARPAASSGVLATIARPWSAFFLRHGAAAGWLVVAIALYALAASMADYLGKNGYVIDIIGADRADTIRATRQAMAPLELFFSLIGGLAGLLIAFRLAPARAFAVLQWLVLALVALFVVCKLALGFTVMTVALLFAARTLMFAAAILIYGVVAARLTAPPHTAGQFAVLGLFAGLFWISEAGMNRLAPLLGSFVVSALAVVAALAAMLCMRRAARAARRD